MILHSLQDNLSVISEIYASEDLRSDRDVVLEALNNPGVCSFALSSRPRSSFISFFISQHTVYLLF